MSLFNRSTVLASLLFIALSPICAQAAAKGRSIEISALADKPLLSGADLKHAEVSGSGDDTLLLVELDSAASARVRSYTSGHLDGRLAILVDGQVISAPRIRAPLDDRFQVGPFAHAEAERLAAVINGTH